MRADHYVLDLDSNAASWMQAAPLPNPRNSLGSAVLNGKIYALGGQYGHDARLITQVSVNVYDPATDTWTALRDLPRARGHIAGLHLCAGGPDRGGGRRNGPYPRHQRRGRL